MAEFCELLSMNFESIQLLMPPFLLTSSAFECRLLEMLTAVRGHMRACKTRCMLGSFILCLVDALLRFS